jgi:hypothetical protein
MRRLLHRQAVAQGVQHSSQNSIRNLPVWSEIVSDLTQPNVRLLDCSIEHFATAAGHDFSPYVRVRQIPSNQANSLDFVSVPVRPKDESPV